MSEPAEHRAGDQPDYATISFDLDDLARLKSHAVAERPYAQRLSTGLVIRLLTTERYDAPFVLDAIDALEELSPILGDGRVGQAAAVSG